MKTSIKKITDLINGAAMLTIDNGISVGCSIETPTGDRDNPWLTISWEDEGLEFEVIVNEGAAESATVKDGKLVLIANDGDPVEVTIYGPHPVSETDIAA